MDANRLSRIISAIGSSENLDSETYVAQVCRASLELLAMSGTGLTLMSDQTEVGAVWASDPEALRVEDLQLSLGEGPALDAFRWAAPALEPDLASASVRWPFFGPAAVGLGVAAVFSFPLQVGVIRLGALNLFRGTSGFLSREELADALVLADVVTQDIIDLQAEGGLHVTVAQSLGRRTHVHQATGIVAAQTGSDMAGALARIRAYAFANEISIFDVADQLIARRLKLDGTL
ncbi:MAG: ANTAR domain-containing protein [Actinomycetota bacterium]